MTKCGYVAIIGKPNAGKSTLLNTLLGERLSIVSPKPETTRRAVWGIFSNEKVQMVFLDTPGIVPRPVFALHKQMLSYIHQSLEEADAVLMIVDIMDALRDTKTAIHDDIRAELTSLGKPAILIINKMDKLENKSDALPFIKEMMESGLFTDTLAISALRNKFTADVITTTSKYLPEREFLYDPQMISTQPQRFFVSEFIREQIFYVFREEIPYSTEVHLTKFTEREESKWFISADIIVDRDSQKGILIGTKGSMLRNVGERSRKAIEEHLGNEVYLELKVRVRASWRDSERALRSLGYTDSIMYDGDSDTDVE